MKGASKVIMGATLVMVVSLAIVLALILVLLAELYCSLLLRSRRRTRPPPNLKESTATSSITNTPTAAAATSTTLTPTITTTNTSSFSSQDNQNQYDSTSPLSSIYAQGVLQAPMNFLFPPPLPCKLQNENHPNLLHHQVIDVKGAQEPNYTISSQIGSISPSPSPSASFATSPVEPVQEISIQLVDACKEKGNFVYISNPIYDNDQTSSRADTPFETPDTSPSRLGNSGSNSSGDDDDDDAVVRVLYSPPLSPMKKLPAQACSVSLRDATSVGTSGSDSNTNYCPSSSSSASPSTSPSW